MGTKERKAREKEIRRQDIIDAAERVFFSKGLAQATMDDVAKEAEYSKRSLYAYFKCKDELQAAIIQRAYALMNQLQETALRKSAFNNALDKIKALGDVYITFVEKYPDYLKAIAAYDNWEGEFPPKEAYKVSCYSEGDKLFQRIADTIREGIADKSIRRDLDVIQTAFILYTGVSGFGQMIISKDGHLLKKHKVNVSDLVQELYGFMIRSLQSPNA